MKDRERLNQAIWDVISTQYKKDARDAHDLRYSIRQDDVRIASYEKEIEEAKRNYERALKNKTEDEEKLRQILAEYGLTGRRTA